METAPRSLPCTALPLVPAPHPYIYDIGIPMPPAAAGQPVPAARPTEHDHHDLPVRWLQGDPGEASCRMRAWAGPHLQPHPPPVRALPVAHACVTNAHEPNVHSSLCAGAKAPLPAAGACHPPPTHVAVQPPPPVPRSPLLACPAPPHTRVLFPAPPRLACLLARRCSCRRATAHPLPAVRGADACARVGRRIVPRQPCDRHDRGHNLPGAGR